jgi:hypothetical protein
MVLALLHNFWYPRALSTFDQVIQADPECAMAYWGAAMTYNHPFWDAQTADEQSAWQLVQKAMEAKETVAARGNVYGCGCGALSGRWCRQEGDPRQGLFECDGRHFTLIAKLRPRSYANGVLRLNLEGEYIGEESTKLARDFYYRSAAEICRYLVTPDVFSMLSFCFITELLEL